LPGLTDQPVKRRETLGQGVPHSPLAQDLPLVAQACLNKTPGRAQTAHRIAEIPLLLQPELIAFHSRPAAPGHALIMARVARKVDGHLVFQRGLKRWCGEVMGADQDHSVQPTPWKAQDGLLLALNLQAAFTGREQRRAAHHKQYRALLFTLTEPQG
jgi:hypothetical protein